MTQLDDSFNLEDLPDLAALSYEVPLQPMAADLKDRLFQHIGTKTALVESALYALLSLPVEELEQKASGLDWQPMQPGMAMATLQVDEAKQQVAFFVRAETGGQFPNHWHAAGEEVLVLTGDFVVDGQTHGPGERIYSAANTAHQPETQGGCLLFCISSVDDEILG